MKKFITALLLFNSLNSHAQGDSVEINNRTPAYSEIISAYEDLSKQFSNSRLLPMGSTDSGEPLHLFLLSAHEIAEGMSLQDLISNKAVLLINNGIHAGEPCGIDASMKFAAELLQRGVPENIVIGIIPVYSVGGALNRNCCTRANQNGPEMYGFRGNARNLDLNRDFIKADALNTLGFYSIFHTLKPHIFIDTHTSNGADYQYTMSLISTQKDKLNPVLSKYLENILEPYLYDRMKISGWEMIPYVNVFGNTPDKGYASFLETPRYASGYTALFNTIGFITEAHMLKPYQDRVEATFSFLNIITKFAEENSVAIQNKRDEAFADDAKSKEMPVNWKLDSSAFVKLNFKGFEYSFPESKISGKPRLKYHNNRPVSYLVNYYNTYRESKVITVPRYYIVPAAWREVPFLLKQNEVELIPLEKDTIIEVSSYYVSKYNFAENPYEGHFPLNELEGEWRLQRRRFYKGDFLLPLDQKNKRFIISVLEPEAVDSYFRWNFYDEVFQQKEWFSSYVFEEEAEQLLNNDAVLRQNFENWKKDNPEQAKDAFLSLYYIYRHSDAYEKEHLRYPVARID